MFKIFNRFFFIFLFLNNEIDYDETQKMKKLFEKFFFFLQKTLNVYSRNFDILIEIKSEFAQMYNNQKKIKKKKIELKTIVKIAARQQRFDFIYFLFAIN